MQSLESGRRAGINRVELPTIAAILRSKSAGRWYVLARLQDGCAATCPVYTGRPKVSSLSAFRAICCYCAVRVQQVRHFVNLAMQHDSSTAVKTPIQDTAPDETARGGTYFVHFATLAHARRCIVRRQWASAATAVNSHVAAVAAGTAPPAGNRPEAGSTARAPRTRQSSTRRWLTIQCRRNRSCNSV